MSAVLSVAQMYQADRLAVEGGVSGDDLMEAAGWAVAREIRRRWPCRRLVVLCGPGNNGGDGFVVARLLARAGWPVRVGLLGNITALKGDALRNAQRWSGPVSPLHSTCDIDFLLQGNPLVVDALFGAGLARPLEGGALHCVQKINRDRLDCVAVDVPSGVCGDSGRVLGDAPKVAVTVSFFRPKPGHFLLPGRRMVGELVIADIGIPVTVLDEIQPKTAWNSPALWWECLPLPDMEDHKYSRGHALIAGGNQMTGAARLAARAARRAGAGLVSVLAAKEALPIYRVGDPGLLVGNEDEWGTLVDSSRYSAALIGPGSGVGPRTVEKTLSALRAGKPCVIDADALTGFSGMPTTLFSAIRKPCLLTPHDGEFSRLFGDADGDRLGRARRAAQLSGAVVVLKGADTVIASPDGRAALNTNAPPDLATAGSGDVLAGIALGLLAQKMPVFEAGCAAVWLHGAAAAKIGRGLIAEDLIDVLPQIWGEIVCQKTGSVRTKWRK